MDTTSCGDSQGAPEKSGTMIRGIWQFYIRRLTDCTIGGKLSESLDPEYVDPLLKVFGWVDGLCQLEFVFDYYGIRYHLLLKQNNEMMDCLENFLLRRVEEDLRGNHNYEEGTWNCLDPFWPIVADDITVRNGKTKKRTTLETRFQQKDTVKIQLLTKSGVVTKAFHNQRSLYPLSEPILNPCPPTVPVFAMKEVELLKEVWGNVFKAKIGENLMCVKAAPANDLRSEIEALMRVPHHPNVIHPLVGVVGARDGYIDKLVIPFIEGKQLSRVRAATIDQKEAWKEQLSDAVSSLHMAGLTWGDGSRNNVMIEEKTGIAIIIDLAFSHFDGHMSTRHNVFESEKEKDLAALVRLNEFIDSKTAVAGVRDVRRSSIGSG